METWPTASFRHFVIKLIQYRIRVRDFIFIIFSQWTSFTIFNFKFKPFLGKKNEYFILQYFKGAFSETLKIWIVYDSAPVSQGSKVRKIKVGESCFSLKMKLLRLWPGLKTQKNHISFHANNTYCTLPTRVPSETPGFLVNLKFKNQTT